MMENNFAFMTMLFENEKMKKLLLKGQWGIEKEAHRTDKIGSLALTPHPEIFGNKLKNPIITTDFAESQIEMITPPLASVEEVYIEIKKIQNYVELNIGDELLWPMSMPPKLPEEDDIPIAKFGDKPEEREKEIYRKGLALRYGKKMQMISGIHYNFSFGEELIGYLRDAFGTNENLQEFTNRIYLHTARNYLRYRWLLIYLFGASPNFEDSYKPVVEKELMAIRTCCPDYIQMISQYDKYATSMRVSRFGYSDTGTENHNIYFNSLDEYVGNIRKLISSKSEKYSKIGICKDGDQIQLNGNVLQKESEFYSSIRLKQVVQNGESQIEALEKRGIKYLEVRVLDINPFDKAGVTLEQLYFMQTFILFCLFEESPQISKKEYVIMSNNHKITALLGRKPKQKLTHFNGKKIVIDTWGKKIFEKLAVIGGLIDSKEKNGKYLKAVREEERKLRDFSLLPSSKIMAETLKNNGSLLEFGIKRAKIIRKEGAKMDNYEELELSTQILIKEAEKRMIAVEVLDKVDNFIRLKKGDKIEYIKQATKTSADTYVSQLIMENKEVTKILLYENGISVPKGVVAMSVEEAENSIEKFSDKSIVIKPKTTNFGDGVVILKTGYSREEAFNGIKTAFQYDSSILIEEFVDGKEYRFLVIDDEAIAVLHRVPANVIGDGEHTIAELAEEKNRDDRRGTDYRKPLEKIKLGFVEANYLKIQGKNFETIPHKGEAVYLRENSNISTGGDSIDFTDDVLPQYKEIAVKAAKTVGAKICGVDIIIKDIKAEPTKDNYSIIELNFNPALHIHSYPYIGENRHAERKVLDLLGF